MHRDGLRGRGRLIGADKAKEGLLIIIRRDSDFGLAHPNLSGSQTCP